MTLANALRLLSVVLVALSIAAGFAHLYALPNKIDLPPAEYFVAQQIYAGWALIGIAILGAIGSTPRPADWGTLGSQGEWSHAAGALLYLPALIALTLSLIVRSQTAGYPHHGTGDVRRLAREQP